MTKTFWTVVFAILGIVAIFMIVSLCMASVHGLGLVAEWQSWFSVAEDAGVEAVGAAKLLNLPKI